MVCAVCLSTFLSLVQIMACRLFGAKRLSQPVPVCKLDA